DVAPAGSHPGRPARGGRAPPPAVPPRGVAVRAGDRGGPAPGPHPAGLVGGRPGRSAGMTVVAASTDRSEVVAPAPQPTPDGGVAGGLRAAARGVLWTCVSLGFAVLVWQLVYAFGGLGDRILPSPSAVGTEVWDRRSLLWSETLVTARPILLGFGAAVLAGTAVGLALAFSRPLERLVYPLLVISQAVPKVALVPILIIWFG